MGYFWSARITPACAGKSWYELGGLLSRRDHPRVCGEKSVVERVAPLRLGSPPRVRGKVRDVLLSIGIIRITPACAGKRHPQGGRVHGSEDHPRVCGEKWHCTYCCRY